MSSPHQHQTRAAVRDAAQESTTSAIVEEECDEKCGNLRGVIPPSASGGDEQCIRQRCLQDSAKSALTVIRVGDHDKESVDVHTSLDFHASDWTTLHDETFPTPADFDVSAKVDSEASESDRKFSPQERQLFHELDEDDESIQSDRDFSSPHAEQERQRETAGTMEQCKGISDAPAHYEETTDISSSYYSSHNSNT
jgi:hypothetical protein